MKLTSTTTVLINATASASLLLSDALSPSDFAHNLQILPNVNIFKHPVTLQQ